MTIELETRIRSAGLRVTEQRMAVLRALETHPHADADEVRRLALGELPGLSLPATYVVLNALTEAGLLRRIEPAGSPARYERRVGDNHHHVVCTGCGAVDDVDCVHGAAPCLSPSSTSGFRVTTAEVTFWGLCPACQAAETTITTEPERT
ncbi:Fur family transcriptional regulator [Herbiconiux sp. VKM Ac-2851]|uniref:Fur family transcriptional regulator n=1 Tax=Herbiconiux sp. VKM Ac-2851 TaxID=2739025 RepID=UPI001565BDD5|nr:Fur family transcriptional regulator [Herbiconiux sp. VKM Ac-2851]NQX35240.1 transcriptional repressor [Herbiconiux sp. VKM Ac-2851]